MGKMGSHRFDSAARRTNLITKNILENFRRVATTSFGGRDLWVVRNGNFGVSALIGQSKIKKTFKTCSKTGVVLPTPSMVSFDFFLTAFGTPQFSAFDSPY